MYRLSENSEMKRDREYANGCVCTAHHRDNSTPKPVESDELEAGEPALDLRAEGLDGVVKIARYIPCA